ncbi:TDP-N-acetylfucosamine:lipid II N-acetylfucosaminyltransferase [Pseudoalteromonas sp. MMG010]|uniref:TDP-N-acetylfucosamine:lipid II N-acetylfucosaminyltransferase n=1 Tax=Pseudoalteromonas sp. MMG010 TaxID=2822685 RepID=UPI001B39D9D2|nr:TDP-N-acetylfucosamine:lipid II N-acetylfucosaminyltransferase [Pseudoalteromonas sp. MMG010]MBQ4834227.1 TDP-N-acetylfucosamine:lipid II N-acetylfucosaminyltransferase [Pseudoalteromonas sp. MMG010]
MKKILHICSDEKFIDHAIVNFNAVDYVTNDFLVISNSKQLKYIKNDNVTIQSRKSFFIQILFGRLNEYDAVVFHSLTDVFKLFIKLLPKRLTICWIGFGFDYYDYSILMNNHREVKGIKGFIKNKILNLNSAYDYINYFSPVLESEFESVSNYLNLKACYVPWNYGSSDSIIEKLKNEYVSGDSILLGNSGAETNDHIEVIKELISLGETREIIVPLSYGGSDEYVSSIISMLEKSSLNYTVLKDFITQAEYFKILKRCSFVIMNHKRQQAMGNIVMMLSLGAKIILDKNNPAYEYLVKLNFNIFDKTQLNSTLQKKLPSNIALKNKNLALENYNRRNTLDKTKRLVTTLINA